jgi:hypothetical protein
MIGIQEKHTAKSGILPRQHEQLQPHRLSGSPPSECAKPLNKLKRLPQEPQARMLPHPNRRKKNPKTQHDRHATRTRLSIAGASLVLRHSAFPPSFPNTGASLRDDRSSSCQKAPHNAASRFTTHPVHRNAACWADVALRRERRHMASALTHDVK